MIRHSSTKISIRGLECFGALKETIYDIQKEIVESGNSDYLVEAFFTATKITLEKSKRSLYQLNEEGKIQDEDSEEEENINSIRDYASDLFFNAYFIGGNLMGQNSKNIFEKILLENFVQGKKSYLQYIQSMEVAIMAAKNVLDATEISEDTLVGVIWNAIMDVKDIKEPTLFHSVLGFMNEGSTYLAYNKSLLQPSLEYIFQGFSLYSKVPFIQSSIFKCLVEICQHAPQSFDEGIFENFLTFIEENAVFIEKNNCSNAMEGI